MLYTSDLRIFFSFFVSFFFSLSFLLSCFVCLVFVSNIPLLKFPFQSFPVSSQSFPHTSSFSQFLFKKVQASQGYPLNRWHKIRPGIISHIKAAWGNLVGGKGSQEKMKLSEIPLFPPLGYSQYRDPVLMKWFQESWFCHSQLQHLLDLSCSCSMVECMWER